MKSPGLHISSDAEVVVRLASVIQASRAIRSEVALSICESSEMRIASRQLRMESARTTRGIAAWRQSQRARKAQRRQWMAQTIAEVLSNRGYAAFVAASWQDTASLQ
jgi:hypothetical protein